MSWTDKDMVISGIIVGILSSFFTTIFFFESNGDVNEYKQKAVDLDYAEYNSKTGEWQWKVKQEQQEEK